MDKSVALAERWTGSEPDERGLSMGAGTVALRGAETTTLPEVIETGAWDLSNQPLAALTDPAYASQFDKLDLAPAGPITIFDGGHNS